MEFKYNELSIIIACVLPLVIFYQINRKVNLIYFVHKSNKLVYFTMKALVAILSIIALMYIKELAKKIT